MINLNHKIKARDAKENPIAAMLTAVFVMFVISGLLLLALAGVLYKAEPGESVIKVGVVVIYVVAGLVGGLFMGKKMREKKFLWGLAVGAVYFIILLGASVIAKGGLAFEMPKMAATLLLCLSSGMAGGMIS
ncbi:MAG: TIGR04086 family membrane protein [Roseburia sp.]